MPKRNEALDALTHIAEPPPSMSSPTSLKPVKAPRETVKVMLYQPQAVKRRFDTLAFHDQVKAHDHYLRALEAYLRGRGANREADMLVHKLTGTTAS